jgi:hypothetical protein
MSQGNVELVPRGAFAVRALLEGRVVVSLIRSIL